MEDSPKEEDCCLNNGRRIGRRRIGKLNLGKSTNNTKSETGIVISTSQRGLKQETLPGTTTSWILRKHQGLYLGHLKENKPKDSLGKDQRTPWLLQSSK